MQFIKIQIYSENDFLLFLDVYL